jgi:hypothetical protein
VLPGISLRRKPLGTNGKELSTRINKKNIYIEKVNVLSEGE